MPTFNQLVRKGRKTSDKKSKSPALQRGFNSLKKRPIETSSPQKRGVCTAVKTATPKTTSLEVHLIQQVLLTENRLVPSTASRSLKLLSNLEKRKTLVE